MNYSKRFLIKPGSKVSLSDIDPDFKDKHDNKEDGLEITARNTAKLRDLQELLYAEHRRSLLICLQAIDAGGKDGTIRHVFATMNPQGCHVASFKKPTSLEDDHDFLWRAHQAAPAKGEVMVFNRSHYEHALIVRIHDLMPEATWSKYYGQINDFEKSLSENGTHILKFFLHISKDEQLKRFEQRLDDPTKHWKINESDYTERKRWGDYTVAFEDMLSKQGGSLLLSPATSTINVSAAAARLVDKVDAFYLPNDNTVISSLESVLKITDDKKIPVFCSDPESVKRGCTASVAPDQYLIGRQAGKMVIRILDGQKVDQIRCEKSKDNSTQVNAERVRLFGLKTSPTEP